MAAVISSLVSIRCCSTTPAAFSPSTSTTRVGRATRSHSWLRVESSEFRPHSSGSGTGGHVWLFFADAVPAFEARRLATMLLTRTMNSRPEIGFKSYDRLFPSQDTMPSGGFGNLIALPLQRRARESGNSVFIDGKLEPLPDQWAFLSTLHCAGSGGTQSGPYRLG